MNFILTIEKVGKSILNAAFDLLELFSEKRLNKRTRISLSIITIIMFFLMFRGQVNDGLGELILLGSSLVYGLFILKVTKTRDYLFFFCNIGLLSIIVLFISANISDNNIHMSIAASFEKARFIGFVLLGTPLTFISLFLVKENNFVKLKDLLP